MFSEILSATNRLLPLDYFLPFYPLNNPKNQTFEKMEKLPGDIILNKCTINENHMMYGSSDMKHDRQNFLSFWTIFTPPNNLKNQILKQKCTKNHDHIMYCCLDMVLNGSNCGFSFWIVFYPFTSLTAQIIKIFKN